MTFSPLEYKNLRNWLEDKQIIEQNKKDFINFCARHQLSIFIAKYSENEFKGLWMRFEKEERIMKNEIKASR